MKPFWRGFETKKGNASNVSFKRHVIVLYWSDENRDVRDLMGKVRLRHPTVKVKTVNGKKEAGKLLPHKITELPTVLLLKDGREVDRITGKPSNTLLEKFFRKATT